MRPSRSLDLARRLRLPRSVALGLFVIGCGGADHATVQEPDAGGEQTEVSSGVNVCPRFDGSFVMPQRIAPDESSMVAVRATDPDAPDSSLAFAWSAPTGTFSASDKPVTNYRCARLGAEQLTVVVRDRRGCASDLAIGVECVSN